MHLGVDCDRADASDRRALVKEVAAHNLAAHFSNNAEEPWMRQQHCDQTGRDVHGRKVGSKVMLAGNGFKLPHSKFCRTRWYPLDTPGRSVTVVCVP